MAQGRMQQLMRHDEAQLVGRQPVGGIHRDLAGHVADGGDRHVERPAGYRILDDAEGGGDGAQQREAVDEPAPRLLGGADPLGLGVQPQDAPAGHRHRALDRLPHAVDEQVGPADLAAPAFHGRIDHVGMRPGGAERPYTVRAALGDHPAAKLRLVGIGDEGRIDGFTGGIDSAIGENSEAVEQAADHHVTGGVPQPGIRLVLEMLHAEMQQGMRHRPCPLSRGAAPGRVSDDVARRGDDAPGGGAIGPGPVLAADEVGGMQQRGGQRMPRQQGDGRARGCSRRGDGHGYEGSGSENGMGGAVRRLLRP